MRRLALAVIPVVALVVVSGLASPAYAAVSVSRADVSGTRLRVEGSATANRDITVDGVVMGRSDSSGRFRISRDPYTRPADCTIDVNDGSATPRTATLSGCTVTNPPPPPPPSGPSAPTPLEPADGASLTTPFPIRWSQVLNPGAINGGYNYQVATSSTFSTFVVRDSTAPSQTQATVSGLANGTYFWRVEAVDTNLNKSAFSTPRSFTVTGAGAGQPGTPTLSLPPYGSSFHPFESFEVFWTAAQGAAKYELLATKDSTFQTGIIKIDNITDTKTGILIGDFCGGCEQGTYFARVQAIAADGARGIPSNTISFTLSYNAPLPPPPSPVSPADGATVSLPFTLDWADVPNPQSSGYEVEVSRNSSFTDIEDHAPQMTSSERQIITMTPGTKWWRVRSHQGNNSPTTSAATDWSTPRTFTVPGGPAAVQAVWLGAPPCQNPCPGADTLNAGQEINASIQLTTAAPAGGAVVNLATSPASAASHPAQVTVPEGTAFTTFRLFAGDVTQQTPATLTATLGSSSSSFNFTVNPSTVKSLTFCCDNTSGLDAGGHLAFTGKVPPGGATVSLSSDSPVAQPPATINVDAGAFSTGVSIPTSEVPQTTTVNISATWNGTTVTSPLRLFPQQPPTSLTLDRTSTTGQEGASGTVRIAAPPETHDLQMRITSSHPDIARTPPYALIGRFAVAGGFMISTQPPAQSTDVTITATGAGVSVSQTLTVHPFGGPTPPPVSLSALGLNPTTVTGGSQNSTGTVTLSGAAPSGGASVTLTSSNANAATVPASVTVPAGSTSATFTVTSRSVTSSSTATVSASYAGVTRSAMLTVNPASQTADTVSVQRAEYDSGKRVLSVEATSTSANATMRLHQSSTGTLIGTLSNDGGGRYRGQFSWPSNPQNVTVRSSLGGTASRAVTLK